ncbi:MAG: patatin-like phospholipase family protein [Acetobacteraceae bacterium]
MSRSDERASEELSLAVRTLGANGEIEVLSSREIARRLRSRLGDHPLRILALSSGGANGAFGAGVLAGAARGESSQEYSGESSQEYSVVTGVSAGALIAPFAFLGPSWDGEMTRIFISGATRDLLRRRPLGALFGASVYSGKPLRRLIDRYVDDAMVSAIARRAAAGRLLLVATTDLSTGEPIIWDLGSIALHDGQRAKPLIRNVLLASASVPGMFPPVVVRFRSHGRMRVETHVDGGVTLPFFIAPVPRDLPESPSSDAGPTIVRVIIDGQLRNLPRPTQANALSVLRRSLSVGLNHETRTLLRATAQALRQRQISFSYAAIPVSYPLHGTFDFAPEAQRSLFEYAASCAAAGRLWIAVPSEREGTASGLLPSAQGPMCPADDEFFERLAALRD